MSRRSRQAVTDRAAAETGCGCGCCSTCLAKIMEEAYAEEACALADFGGSPYMPVVIRTVTRKQGLARLSSDDDATEISFMAHVRFASTPGGTQGGPTSQAMAAGLEQHGTIWVSRIPRSQVTRDQLEPARVLGDNVLTEYVVDGAPYDLIFVDPTKTDGWAMRLKRRVN